MLDEAVTEHHIKMSLEYCVMLQTFYSVLSKIFVAIFGCIDHVVHIVVPMQIG